MRFDQLKPELQVIQDSDVIESNRKKKERNCNRKLLQNKIVLRVLCYKMEKVVCGQSFRVCLYTTLVTTCTILFTLKCQCIIQQKKKLSRDLLKNANFNSFIETTTGNRFDTTWTKCVLTRCELTFVIIMVLSGHYGWWFNGFSCRLLNKLIKAKINFQWEI